MNAIISVYTAKLGLRSGLTNIDTQKIHGTTLKIYGIVSASFLPQDRLGKIWFFEETFLLANTSMEVVLEMLFLFFSNTDFQFDVKKHT